MSASAQCVQVGSDVTCTGTDSDGFPDVRPPTDDDLNITVESGALVENPGGSGATIALLQNNVVVIEQNGSVTSTGGQTAISGASGVAGDPIRRNLVTNAGILSASGSGSRGIVLRSFGEVVNEATGQVLAAPGITGGDAVGIQVGANGSVVNDGLVSAVGDAAIGISATAAQSTANSSGSVQVNGAGAIGIAAQTVDHSGTTTATGDAAIGISATAAGATANSSGSVQVNGAGAIGIAAQTLDHSGTTTVTGDGSIGLRAALIATNQGVVDVQGDFTAGILGAAGGEVVNAASGSVTVSGDSSAGLVANAGGIARNEGQVTVAGADGGGLFGQSNDSTLVTRLINTGTVTVTGDATAAAFATAGVDIENEGLLDATASPDGVGVRLVGDESTVRNSGIIRGGTGVGAGIAFADASSTTNPETRSALNLAGGLIESAGGVAVRGGTAIDAVTNRGDIQGDVLLGDGNDAFGWGDGSNVGGALDGEGGDDQLFLVQSDPDAPVNASFDLGNSVGFEDLVVGIPGDTNTWTLTGTGSYTDGIFASHGELRIDLAANVADEIIVNGGLLHLEDGVTLPNGVRVEDGRALYAPGADVTLPLRTADTGIVVLDGINGLQGDADFQGGVVEAEFSAGSNERLDVDGNLTLGSQSLLQLVKTDPGPIAGEPIYRVLTASAGRAGRFGDVEIVNGTSPFLRGIPTYGSGAGHFVDVQLTRRFEPIGRSADEHRVGQYLDDAVAAGVSPDFQSLLDTFPALTNDQAADALDSLHGAAYDAQTSTALATATRYAHLLAQRPPRCERLVSPYRPDEASRSPCGPRGLTPWVAGFGLFADRNGSAGQPDYSHAGGGIAFGVDQRFGDGFLVSGLLGTSRSALDLDNDGDGSYTSFELGLGAAWNHSGGTHLRASVGYGHGWHTTHRDVSYPGFSRLALSSHDSDRVTVAGEVGHVFSLVGFEVEPVAAVEYTYLFQESIQESNAGVVRLDIDSRSTSFVATDTGARIGMTLVKYAYMGDWLEWADGVWRPQVQAGWRQVWTGYDRDFDARLTGAPSTTPKLRVRSEDAQYGANVGGRVSFQPFGTRNSIEIAYDAFVGDRTTAHTVLATFRMPF